MNFEIRRHSWDNPPNKWCIFESEDETQKALISGMSYQVAANLKLALSNMSKGNERLACNHLEMVVRSIKA